MSNRSVQAQNNPVVMAPERGRTRRRIPVLVVLLAVLQMLPSLRKTEFGPLSNLEIFWPIAPPNLPILRPKVSVLGIMFTKHNESLTSLEEVDDGSMPDLQSVSDSSVGSESGDDMTCLTSSLSDSSTESDDGDDKSSVWLSETKTHRPKPRLLILFRALASTH
jgi:hypothetical protein